MCSGRLSRPACSPAVGIEFEPELGGDHHLLAEGSEGFAHEFFVRERAVDFGGIEECDAAFDGRPDQRDHLLLVCSRTVAEAHSHAAEPESRNFQVAFSQFALLHCFSSCHRLSARRRRRNTTPGFCEHAERVARHVSKDGNLEAAPGLFLSRSSSPTPVYRVSEPHQSVASASREICASRAHGLRRGSTSSGAPGIGGGTGDSRTGTSP